MNSEDKVQSSAELVNQFMWNMEASISEFIHADFNS